MTEVERTPAFREYITVQRYEKGLEDLPPAERDRRLRILEQFCDVVDRTPDRMVEELFDTVTRKYRRRGFYTEQIRQFSEICPGSSVEGLFRGNVIRAFFIANGYRIPPPRPSWM